MRRFDAAALYDALNARREALAMTWTQVAAATGVSVSTLRGTQRGGRLEVDGVLAMVGWLGRSVESFVSHASTSSSERSHRAGSTQ